jgi:hypothetical protein
LDTVYKETAVVFYCHQTDASIPVSHFYSGNGEVEPTSTQASTLVWVDTVYDNAETTPEILQRMLNTRKVYDEIEPGNKPHRACRNLTNTKLIMSYALSSDV